MPAPVEAGGHVAVRSFEAAEAVPHGVVTVTIEARGFGRFARVSETLPDGWTYVDSTLPDAAVVVEGDVVRFIVIGDGDFRYTVAASGTEGTYAFSGLIEDDRREAATVGGEHEITVRYREPVPVAIEVQVRQYVGESCPIYANARRVSTSRPMPRVVPLALEGGSGFPGRYRHGELALEPASRMMPSLDVRVSQATTDDCSVFVGARSGGDSWLRVGMIPVPMEGDIGAEGGWRDGRIELRVPPPDGRPLAACSNGTAVRDPERHPELVRDCAVLLQERDALEGGAGGLNWSAGRPIGDWGGITVGGEPLRVTGVSVRSGLGGLIPPGLARLDRLQVLSLPDNQLTGGIPRELGLLSALRVIDLSRSGMSGRIPAELGLLVELRELSLPGNELEGEFPAGIASLPHLWFVDLRDNRLSGEIPAVPDREPPVDSGSGNDPAPPDPDTASIPGPVPPFALGSCGVSPTVDDCATLLEAAETLVVDADLNWSDDLDLHHWTGVTVNPWTGRVIGVKLRGLGLDGQVPAALTRLPELKLLDLGDNELAGRIPPELGRCANLRDLDLGDNRLRGRIPAELAELADLETLSLSGNELTGGIPAGLGMLERLSRLNLDGNRLSGCIPGGLERFAFHTDGFSNLMLRRCPSDG